MKLEVLLMSLLTTIVIGISSWSLIKLVNMGEALARVEVNLSNVSARIADIEK